MGNILFKSEEQLGEKLGQGAFGAVYRTKKNGKEAALKLITWSNGADLSFALREATILLKVKGHPNIVEIYSVENKDHSLLIYMEYCNEGHFQSYLEKKKPSIDQVLVFLLQLVSAVEFIHSKNVIHRDIKPANILMTTEGGKTVLKLADFGVGNVAATMGYFGTFAGTPYFMAPEVRAESRHYTFSADVYSLGVVFRKAMEYYGNSEKKESVLKIAKEMVYEDPKQRMALSDVKKRLQSI